jgi:hypothetical protein
VQVLHSANRIHAYDYIFDDFSASKRVGFGDYGHGWAMFAATCTAHVPLLLFLAMHLSDLAISFSGTASPVRPVHICGDAE